MSMEWERRFQTLEIKFKRYKRYRNNKSKNSQESGQLDGIGALLQTIALQNIQLQQSLLNQNNRFGNLPNVDQGYASTYLPSQHGEMNSRREKYQQSSQMDHQRPIDQVMNATERPLQFLQPNSRRQKIIRIRSRWRVIIYAVLSALFLSKKFRLMKQVVRKSKSFIEISLDELEEKLGLFTRPLRDQVRELSNEGADFLFKDASLSIFTRKPSKAQTLKYSGIINGYVDLAMKITFHGSIKSKDLMRKLLAGNGIPRSYFWDNEITPPASDENLYLILVYFVLVKCLILRFVLKPLENSSEIEEHNARALALVLFRIARQVGLENPVEVDSQFKRMLLVFSKTDESFRNITLFKAFAADIKVNAAKLTSWAKDEVYYDSGEAVLMEEQNPVPPGIEKQQSDPEMKTFVQQLQQQQVQFEEVRIESDNNSASVQFDDPQNEQTQPNLL